MKHTSTQTRSWNLTRQTLAATLCLLLLYCLPLRAQVRFSEPSGVKTRAFSLILTSENPERKIYYTLDGSTPNDRSQLYERPITIFESTIVTAISYLGGNPDELASKAGYAYLSEDVQAFTSNLPVMVLDNLGQGALPAPPANAFMGGNSEVIDKQFAVSALYEPVNGRTRLTSPPTLETNAGVKVRGSSSSSFPKKSYGWDSWDAQCQEKDIEPLGMAESADWVLYGSQMYDPTYIRSVVPYTLSNQMGQWAPRSVAVEMFVNIDGGPVSMDDYAGMYFFMEKIGRGKDKLDIEKLDASVQAADAEISGGYIIKVDRLDAGATGFTTLHSPAQYSYNTTNYYYPKERTMPDYQKPWIRSYIADFENALRKIPFSREYADYFDVRACIDHWLLKAMPMEFDAFILSEFMHKDRGGKIKMGPIWDLDRSAGSLDTRQSDPVSSWEGGGPVKYMDYGWYGYLFDDPEFYQAVKDRWFELRQTVLSTSNIHAVIDSLAFVMDEAMVRDAALWPVDAKYGGSFHGAIDFYKNWLSRRVVWIDGQFGGTPTFLHESAPITGASKTVSPGYALTIQSAAPGTIYYTTDGTDPRTEDGSISSTARVYSSSLAINMPTVVTARSYNGVTWSSFRKLSFLIQQDLSKLKITEISYHPAQQNNVNGDDLEFIELKNTGTSILYLSGVYFADGIEFTFPASSILAPGDFILLANNAVQFRLATGIDADFQYDKGLSNKGERIALHDAYGQLITEASYSDQHPWPVAADGLGYTLVPIAADPIGGQDLAALWRASSKKFGSPGADDHLAGIKEIYISEIRSHSLQEVFDAVELYNPHGEAADIGGWLLNNDLSAQGAWEIPRGTTIPTRSYLVLREGHSVGNTVAYTEAEFGRTLSISSSGDDVFLLSTDNSVPSGYAHGYHVPPALPDGTYGLHTTSTGEQHVVCLDYATFGAANTAPRVGPLVITQIMYQPLEMAGIPSTGTFVCIKNISDSTVKLYDMQHPENTWKIDGLSFSFPPNTQMQAGEIIYLKNNSLPSGSFRDRYQLSSSTRIFSFAGTIDPDGESIAIQMPLISAPGNGTTKVAYADIDKVHFRSAAPWPAASANGKLLQRIDDTRYADDPANWQAADGMGRLPQAYTLTMAGGKGAGTYCEGYLVIVNASIPEGKSFLKWSGTGAAYLENIYRPAGVLTMPGKDVSLVAEYVDVATEKPIALSSQWKYRISNTDLGSAWRQPGYNDSQWQNGNTPIGTAGSATTISIGSMWASNTTTYFRKSVTINEASKISQATLRLSCKDGAVVYINGTEAFRTGMPSGSIAYSTYASADLPASEFKSFSIDPSLFAEGNNTVQVEVHIAQAMFGTVADLYFDLELSIGKAQIPSSRHAQYIALEEGWNLVTLIVEPDLASPRQLFPNARAVKSQDGFFSAQQAEHLNSLTEIHGGDALLIFNSKTEQIAVRGSIYTSLHSYPLRTGWNLAGVPRRTNISISELPAGAIEAKDYDSFFQFGTQQGNLLELRGGKAYFIKMRTQGELLFISE